jgi:DNA-binding XRE family transcriptional regulator
VLKAKESYSMWDGMDIRNHRDTLGMTQRALARALGISHRMLCYYEAGEREIPKSVELSLRYVVHNRKEEQSGTLEVEGTLEPQGTLTAFDRERISRLCLAVDDVVSAEAMHGLDADTKELYRMLSQSLKEIDYLLSKFPE